MSFNKLVGKLKSLNKAQETTLSKSAPAAYPLSTQSLDHALKSCKSLGYGEKTQTLLKDMHAAGCAAGIADAELESHIAGSMRKLASKKTMTKSLTPGEALAGQLDGGEPAPAFNHNAVSVNPSTEAIHRARAQEISDAQFMQEIAQSGAVATVDIVALDNTLAMTRGLPDEVRAAGFTAVRQQVSSVADLSPAARGIDW